MNKISVVIVDDHQLLRELLVDLIGKKENYEIAGEAGGYHEALILIAALKPAIVLLDINLKDGSGVDAVPLILKSSPKTKIVALTMHHHPAFAQKIFKAGGHAYVTKNSSHQEILTAIDEVLNDRIYVCDEIKNELSFHLLTSKSKEPGIELLSAREKEIVKFLKEGQPSRDIAAALNISLKTVQAHRHNIFKKLKVNNITSLINYLNDTELNYANY